MMSALMSDLIEGRITPSVGNATCNATGKLLKLVELKLRYGKPTINEEQDITLGIEGETDAGRRTKTED